jgi:anti-sigma regulatory factor (Ser/Thr protein kinase)
VVEHLPTGWPNGPSVDGDVFSVTVARLPSALAPVRWRLRSWLERSGIDPQMAADITLACSEACANAVEHPVDPSRHALEVEATRTPEGIQLSVRDFGTWRPRDSDPTPRGRGLRVIQELMDEIEVVTGKNETTIVMRRKHSRPRTRRARARAGDRARTGDI